MRTVPYKAFGENRDCPLFLYVNGKPVDIENEDASETKWSFDAWISTTPEWRALLYPDEKVKDKRVRVMTPFWWESSPKVEEKPEKNSEA